MLISTQDSDFISCATKPYIFISSGLTKFVCIELVSILTSLAWNSFRSFNLKKKAREFRKMLFGTSRWLAAHDRKKGRGTLIGVAVIVTRRAKTIVFASKEGITFFVLNR